MDEETRREIILEHYMQPLHKHKTEDTSYEMSIPIILLVLII